MSTELIIIDEATVFFEKKKEMTRPEFKLLTRHDLFIEYKRFASNIYKIEFNNSHLIVFIQKTKEGVEINYLGSEYEKIEDKIKLIAYATFVIAYRVNKNKGFKTVSFEGC